MITALWFAPMLLAVIAFPRWPHSRQWGYLPAAGLALIGITLLALHLLYVI